MAKKKVTGEDGKTYVMKEKKPFYKKVWVWILVVIVVAAIGGSLGGGDKDKADSGSKDSSSAKTEATSSAAKESTVESSAAAESDSKATYKDRTLTAPDGVLKITGFERGTDYEGKPMFYVFFDLTNNTKEAQNVQIQYMSFVQAKQNTGATTENLEMAILMDNPYREKADLLQKDINPGATVSGVYYYNFADENQPVTFEFTDTMFSFDGPIATEDIQIP